MVHSSEFREGNSEQVDLIYQPRDWLAISSRWRSTCKHVCDVSREFGMIPKSAIATGATFTNNPVRSYKSLCKHVCDVLREFGTIRSTHQNPPPLKPWATAQVCFFLKSQPPDERRLYPQAKGFCSESAGWKFSGNLHQQSRTQLEIYLQAYGRCFKGI